MALDIKGRRRRQGTLSLDLLLWLLLAAILLPLVVALQTTPFAGDIAVWVIPAAALSGLGIGLLLVIATMPRRWWWVPLAFAPLLGAALVAGGALAARGGHDGDNAAATTLVGAYAATLSAFLPWLVFRAKRPWLGVVLGWITVAGAWGTTLTPAQVWWLVWLLAISLLVIGLSHLREEMQAWHLRDLQRLGPVLWPSARTILALSLLIAVVGLLPLGAAQLSALSAFWQRGAAGQSGPLSFIGPSGTPAAVLGASLSLDAPDVSSNTVVLTYDIVQGPVITPPLLGATLDTFDGATWSRSHDLPLVPLAGALTPPKDTERLEVNVTVGTLPRTAGGSFLLGFEQPLSFSVPVQVRVSDDGTPPSALTISSWETATSLAPGASYTTVSAVLPDTATGTGTIPQPLLARLTQLPTSLDPSARTIAARWAGTTGSPTERAHALLAALQANLRYDPKASPPQGADPVSWTLAQHRGNLLTLTTTYILLGRMVGLPLRLAEGYLPGTFDAKLRHNVVRASDGTVWAQLAVPGTGWLDLFPVSTEVQITVPSKIIYSGVQPTPTPQPTPQATANPNQQRTPPSTPFTDPTQQHSTPWLLGALIAATILLLALALALVGRWRWARYGAHLAPLGQFFARIGLLCRLAGIALRASDTSSQATAKVTAYLPEQTTTLVTLNGAYERIRYGPPGNQRALPNLQEYWQRISRALWRMVMTRPWRRPRRQP